MKSVTFIRNIVFLVSFFLVLSAGAFAPPMKVLSPLTLIYATGDSSPDPKEIIGKTITIRGDVNGGYVRTCIKNEASKFRRLIGTMSPPTDDDTATVYVEGKRKMVDGFVRWCEKGTKKIGLSQTLEVVEAVDEVPTGLYDGFYVKMAEETKEA